MYVTFCAAQLLKCHPTTELSIFFHLLMAPVTLNED